MIRAFDATHHNLILVGFRTVHEEILKGEPVQKLGSNDGKKLDCCKMFLRIFTDTIRATSATLHTLILVVSVTKNESNL
jgi:hypothetical protein